MQQTLLGDAAEHARVGILVWNAELRYIAVNPEACRLIGVDRTALLGAVVGEQNQTGAAAAIESVLGQVPASGRLTTRAGLELDWMVFATTAAGLPHLLGIMWEARTPHPPETGRAAGGAALPGR